MAFMKKHDPVTAFDAIEETPISIDILVEILTYRRSARSEGDVALVDNLIMPLDPTVDPYGNLFVSIGKAPSVAFTAHTDTVHRDTAHNPRLTQTLSIEDGLVELANPGKGDVLGADDGTGIWVLLNLIEAGVEGLYCFFRDEEIGRLGSEWSVQHEPERYTGIDMMLSFDRMGTTDIITHQMGDRCCSELFATHIADAIDKQCEPDPTGSFTDSCSFMDLISECTNICVGYYDQHSSLESQDLTWVAFLVNRLIAMEWNAVPAERDPTEVQSPMLDGCDMADMDLSDILYMYPDEAAYILETYMGMTQADMVDAVSELHTVESPGADIV